MLLDEPLVRILERVRAVRVHAHHQRLFPISEALEIAKHAVAWLKLRRRLGGGGMLLLWRRRIRFRRCWPLELELGGRRRGGHRDGAWEEGDAGHRKFGCTRESSATRALCTSRVKYAR